MKNTISNITQEKMKCIICYENMKAECGGFETNWSQRCITCKDSWVCGSCYHTWDITTDFYDGYKVMPCVMCRKPMNYSNLVNSFNEGTGVGWWNYIDEEKPIWEYLYKVNESYRLVLGIKCGRCGVYLEPHTEEEHLDINHKVHLCEGGHKR